MFEATAESAPAAAWGQGEWSQGEDEWNQNEWNQNEWNQGEDEWRRRRRNWRRRRRYQDDDDGPDEEYGPEREDEGESEGDGEEQFLPIIAAGLKLLPTILGGISSLVGSNREQESQDGESEDEEHFLLDGLLKKFLGEAENEDQLPLHPAQESELVGRLLDVSGEDELRQVLVRIVDGVGSSAQGVRNAAGSPQGRALVDAVAPLARMVVPSAGLEHGEVFATGQAGSIGHEQQAYEAARQAVRLTAAAARNVAAAPPGAPPEVVGELGLIRAATRFAPGLARAAGRAFSVARRALGYGAYRGYRGYGGYRGYRGYGYGRPGYRDGYRGPGYRYGHRYGYRYPDRYRYRYPYGYAPPAGYIEPPPPVDVPAPPPEPPQPPPPQPPQPGYRWVAVPIGAPVPLPGPAGPPPAPPEPPVPADPSMGAPAGAASAAPPSQGEWYGGDREWGNEWAQNGHRNGGNAQEWGQGGYGQNEWSQGQWG